MTKKPKSIGAHLETVSKKHKGKYVVFEGLEGCGKSTQIKLFFEALRKKEDKCIMIKEPVYDSRIGQMIKNELTNTKEPLDIMGLQFLFVADRFENFAKNILPKLSEGYTIISDRNWMSTATHVAAFAHPPYNDLEWMMQVHSKLVLPDAIFYINVSPNTAHKRIESRGNQIRRFDTLKNLELLDASYQKLSKKYEKIWHNINGEKSLEEVQSEIVKEWEML